MMVGWSMCSGLIRSGHQFFVGNGVTIVVEGAFVMESMVDWISYGWNDDSYY